MYEWHVCVCVCVWEEEEIEEYSIASSIALYHFLVLFGYIIILPLPQLLRVQQKMSYTTPTQPIIMSHPFLKMSTKCEN